MCNTNPNYDFSRHISKFIAQMMNEGLRHDIARYVDESERSIRVEERKCQVLQEQVEICQGYILKLQNDIRKLEDENKQQQAMLDIRTAKDKVAQRKCKRNDTYSKQALGKAFGCNECSEDSSLYHAALGFMKGSQLKNKGAEHGEDQMEEDATTQLEKRCMEKGRKTLLAQMVTYMYGGEIVRNIEAAILKKKRFCTVTLARVSDMNSTFTASAVGCIAKCEGGKEHGEMGLLCGESTLRRTMDLVHDQAVQLGFSFMPAKGLGKVWCWGEDDSHLLTKAINMYVKAVYCDAC